MTQTVPATVVLGPGKTGLEIGLRVLNLDGTVYAAFSTTGVAETATPGTYRKTNGLVVPSDGGYIVWGTSLVDYAEATVESTAVNVTMQAGVLIPGPLALEATAQAILEDTGTTLPAALAALSELDLDTALEGTVTVGEALRVMLAALAGVSAGGGSATITFAAVDGESNRITATVDANGNRTAVTLDGAA